MRGDTRAKPVTLATYDDLASDSKTIKALDGLYHSLHAAASEATGPAGAQPLNVTSSTARASVSKSNSSAGLDQVAYSVTPAKGLVPVVEAVQMLGFMHPFDSERMLVTQSQRVKPDHKGSLNSTFGLHLLALSQELPAGAESEKDVDVRTVLAYGRNGQGDIKFDVLYAESCDVPLR